MSARQPQARPVRLDARPEGLALEPSRTALVVVDMQNAFVNPGGLLDLAGIDISGAPATVEARALVEDATLQAGPPFCQQATVFNVEHFFGWVTTSQALERAAAATTAGAAGAT